MSIAAKIGCSSRTLNGWVKKAEVDSGKRVGSPTEMADRMTALERENRALRQANGTLRKAGAHFAMVRKAARHRFWRCLRRLDRRSK